MQTCQNGSLTTCRNLCKQLYALLDIWSQDVMEWCIVAIYSPLLYFNVHRWIEWKSRREIDVVVVSAFFSLHKYVLEANCRKSRLQPICFFQNRWKVVVVRIVILKFIYFYFILYAKSMFYDQTKIETCAKWRNGTYRQDILCALMCSLQFSVYRRQMQYSACASSVILPQFRTLLLFALIIEHSRVVHEDVLRQLLMRA